MLANWYIWLIMRMIRTTWWNKKVEILITIFEQWSLLTPLQVKPWALSNQLIKKAAHIFNNLYTHKGRTAVYCFRDQIGCTKMIMTSKMTALMIQKKATRDRSILRVFLTLERGTVKYFIKTNLCHKRCTSQLSLLMMIY